MKKRIFLAGPMRGIERSSSLGWRQQAEKLLSSNFEVIHAMRGREEKETFIDYRAAIGRDKADIISSDILLVNDTFENSSMIGTAMEVFFAHSLDKIVIVFGHAHEKDYWLNYHNHSRLDNLEEACEYLNRLFK